MNITRVSYNIWALLICCLFVSSCTRQNKTTTQNRSIVSREILHRSSKIKKNHFITVYPDEFFFIQCGLQDNAANMWFGSAGDGIYVYDAQLHSANINDNQFINFTQHDGLCHNDILCCMKDQSGTIWFGTRNGLIRYKPSGWPPESKDFSSYLIMENTVSKTTHKKIPYIYEPAENFVWSIMQDKTGKLWFGTNQGIYIHDPVSGMVNDTPTFIRFLEDDEMLQYNLHLKEVTSMHEDKTGMIWFVSGYSKGRGICRFDPHLKDTSEKLKAFTYFQPDGIKTFRTIIERKNGSLLFLSTFHGVYSYDPNLNHSIPEEPHFINLTKKIGIQQDTLIAMFEDHAGILWFGRNSDQMKDGGHGGVWRYDDQEKDHAKSLILLTIKDGLSHNCVFTIVEDKDGNIWFGTRNTGLCRYDGKSFTNFTE
jgi:ligand-binding sensor domain-containing protein